ncbi:MAG: nucleotide exchange factor GrpE [Planctomycetes bacterium]|nr:nucleotide exchange factor GrpE [Planctomycetota bacterium]
MNHDEHSTDPQRSDEDPKRGATNASTDAADAPDESAPPAPDVEERLARTEDQLRRAMADLANFQRRKLKDVEDARRRAIEGMAAELLPVVDNFHLALGATEQGDQQEGFDIRTIVEGMRMVRSMLESVLERHGLAEIPATGTAFDPNLHDAVGVDSSAESTPGTVTRVMQRGYRIGDKVLRPSRVIVSGQPDAES